MTVEEEYYDDGGPDLTGYVNVLLQDKDISPGASTTALGYWYQIVGDL